MNKNYSVIILLFVVFTFLGVVSAADNNTVETDSQTVITYDNNNQEDLTQTFTETETNDNKETETTNLDDDELEGSGCCTTIIQGSNNDSALSFRRDSINKLTLNIKYNSTIIRQYKENSYFFHVLISKDGWLVGNGGADNAAVNTAIQNNALAMINQNKITSTNMNNIYKQENKLILGHFVIKAPNGTYSLIIKRDGRIFKDSGVLKEGEYLVVPNSMYYFKKGSLNDISTENKMISNSRLLAARDAYGVERREIITYYYKNNVVNSSVKISATNDNGKYVGRNTRSMIDHIKTNTKYVSSSNIPVLDGSIQLDTVNFNIRKTKVSVSSETKYTNGENVVLTATVKDEFGKAVNSGFVSILVNDNTLKYNNGSTVYLNVKNGQVSFNTTLPNIWKRNNFTYYMRYYGNSIYEATKGNKALIYVNNPIKLITQHNSNILYGGTLTLTNTLSYIQNSSKVSGGKVFYKINGKTIRDSKGDTLTKNVDKGQVTFNYTFDSRYKAKNYTITTIYVRGIVRKEFNTTITIDKIPTEITSPKIRVNKDTIYFTGKLVDKKNKRIVYDSYLSVKINGKTLKDNNITRKFAIKEGVINFNFTIPYKLKKGNHTLNIVLPELKETLSLRNNYTFSIV